MATHFGERLKALARALGKEDQDVAHDLGLSKSQMSHYTTGKRKVPSEILQKIVDTYGINPQFLFDKDAPLYIEKEESHLIMEQSSRYETNTRYPYFPISVSAGLPIGIEPIIQCETIAIPNDILGKHAGSKEIYFMKVNGESMNKVIPHGSLIAVKQVELQNLKSGDIVVYSNGYDYALKRYYKIDNKLIFRPESTDPSFTDIIVDESSEEIRLHGKVIMYIVNLD